MTRLMPLKRVVTELTHEARSDDPEEIRRKIKSWHNRLNVGSIPRTLIRKLGRELFLDLDAWEEWLAGRSTVAKRPGRGRPRTSTGE
jgi:hypothetical protein